MPYATLQDLNTRFGAQEIINLADKDGDGIPDAGVVDAAIADADETIDSYIGNRVQLPLATTPPLINRLCCNIARYELYADAAPDIVTARYNAAIALLKSISSGAATLGLDAADEPPAADSPQVAANAPARVFTTDSLKDFTDDPY